MAEEFDSAVRVVPRYDAPRYAIRVTKDGNKVTRELMVYGQRAGDIGRIELIDFLMQAASSLRYD